MVVEQFAVGGDRNFGYLVADETSAKAAVIDPCYSPDMIVDYARQKNWAIVYSFNTHQHYDHTNGNQYIRDHLGIPTLAWGSRTDDGTLIEDGTVLPLGKLELHIIHTPGHTADSICIYVPGTPGAVFTGDTLFVGKVGGTDYGENARREYDSLHQKLMRLPDDTVVWPGHNYGVAPSSTIANEKQTNPFLLQPDFNAFVDLKRNWLEYKRKHGIA
ncbi:MAG: MBL fold metallo-hydrolase [Lentisphaerae bacterium]|nr:MAG: MBL fold metallo-hydrolase [Lentisphaerota bacterium]